MEWNLFIIPLTLIAVELIKRTKIDKIYLPWVAVAVGAVLGAVFAAYYQQDYLMHIVSGVIYGAAASGIYDASQTHKYN